MSLAQLTYPPALSFIGCSAWPEQNSPSFPSPTGTHGRRLSQKPEPFLTFLFHLQGSAHSAHPRDTFPASPAMLGPPSQVVSGPGSFTSQPFTQLQILHLSVLVLDPSPPFPHFGHSVVSMVAWTLFVHHWTLAPSSLRIFQCIIC